MRMDEPDGCNGLKPIGGETDVAAAAAVVIVGAVDGMMVDGSGCGCIVVAVGGGGGGDV